MHQHLRCTTLALGAAITLGAASVHAQPYYTDTQGWLDFRGAVGGGGALAKATVGPYKAGFSTVSAAQANAAGQFSVYCFDWLGAAVDTRVQVLTFAQAIAYGPLALKFADNPEGTAGGLTLNKLNQAAWLSTQFTNVNQGQWKDIHHAIWATFWDTGLDGFGGVLGLPVLTAGASTFQANAAAAVAGGFDASSYRVLVSMNDAGTEFIDNRQIFLAQAVVPEPSTYALMGAGLLALGMVARRRRTAKQ